MAKFLPIQAIGGGGGGALCPQLSGGAGEDVPVMGGDELPAPAETDDGLAAAVPAPSPASATPPAPPPLLCNCAGERGFTAAAWLLHPVPTGPLWDTFKRRLVDGVRPPLSQPALVLGVQSWSLSPGHLNPVILCAAGAYARVCPFDDLMVRKNGQQGPFVHKSNTRHASADRRHESLCHGANALSTYSMRGFCDNPSFWTMNHMCASLPTAPLIVAANITLT